MMKLARVSAIVCACLLLTFCGHGGNRSAAKSVQPAAPAGTGSTAGSPEPAASPAKPPAPAAQGPTRITVAPQAAATPAAGGRAAAGESAAAAKPASAAFTGRETEYLMESGLAGRIIPSDDRIGPLQDRFAQDAETRRMYGLVDRFLTALSDRKVVQDSILPDTAPFLVRRLQGDLAAGYLPESWRIGRIERPDTVSAHMRVILIGSPGSAAGDIFLEKSSDRWYISGIQVEFAQLATPPADSKPVEPGTPTWMNNAQ